MMGEKRARDPKLFHYGFCLDERIPEDHVLRRVSDLVDFSFVRATVKNTYGHNGHRSEDPIVLMKLMFLLFFEDVKSERELLRVLPMRLDWLWFCGFDIDDEIPNHSVLSKARARWGMEVFEELFVRIVGQCVQAGLVDGAKLHMDGSLIEADASIDACRKGPPELIEALKLAYGATERRLEDAARYASKRKRAVMSTTDPDAASTRQGRSQKPGFRYKEHRAVDDKCGVVTAVETTPGDVAENTRLASLVEEHEQNTSKRVSTVIADNQYGTNENFAWCSKRGIRSHMGDLRATHNHTHSKGIFSREKFHYDAANDCFICPAGEKLTRRRQKHARNAVDYAASKKACNACALKPQCTRSKMPRNIRRHNDQDLIDVARTQSHSTAAKRDRIRRKYLMEGSFADAANHHHLKRARWRMLWRQQVQGKLIATCQNIRILLNHTPQKSPAGAVTGQLVTQKAIIALQTVYQSALKAFYSLTNIGNLRFIEQTA